MCDVCLGQMLKGKLQRLNACSALVNAEDCPYDAAPRAPGDYLLGKLQQRTQLRETDNQPQFVKVGGDEIGFQFVQQPLGATRLIRRSLERYASHSLPPRQRTR